MVQQNLLVLVDGDGWHLGEYVHDVFGNSGVIVELDVEPHCETSTTSSLLQNFFSCVVLNPHCQFLVLVQGVHVFLRWQQPFLVLLCMCVHLQVLGLRLWSEAQIVMVTSGEQQVVEVAEVSEGLWIHGRRQISVEVAREVWFVQAMA